VLDDVNVAVAVVCDAMGMARWYGFDDEDAGRGVRPGDEEARATCSRELTDTGGEGC
jgi:hypothetical protein